MKVALVCAEQTSEWVSCRSITRNLLLAYENAYEKNSISTFSYELSTDHYQAKALASKIKDSNPNLIGIIDYKPHPYGLIKALLEVYGEKDIPPINIHIFGDFVLNCLEWLELEDDLKKIDARFICASDKQKDLLDNLLDHRGSTSVIPFPIDTDDFSYNSNEKNYLTPLGIEEDEIIITYTGRLTLQKNIFLLMTAFAELQQNFLQKARLVLAGPIDDLGMPYLGKERPPGNFYYDFQHLLKHDIPAEAAKRIHYLGNLSHVDLAKLYCSSHLYASFSTHNDEDFGMSPAEAACTGLPMVLSNWGGYSSFKHALNDHCQLVATSMQSKGDNQAVNKLAPKKSIAIKSLLKSAMITTSKEQREELSKQAKEYLSIEAVSKKIIDLEKSQTKFNKFSPLFIELCQAFKDRPKSPFKSYGGSFSHLYERIYKVYAK